MNATDQSVFIARPHAKLCRPRYRPFVCTSHYGSCQNG